ncbi:MAG TPA: fibronectin type III domain-containing protein, partial [Chitinophagaceae bacterium]|nr:fibronectin type III domain-containing protein [Chitinophagaceae bacterium]
MKKTILHRGKSLFLFLFFVIITFKNNSLHAQVTIASVDTKTGTGSTVHTLTSIPSGRLLVVVTMGELHSSTSCSVSSSPSLTWTKRVDAQATNSGDAEIWTAVTSSSGNITVTCDWPSAANQASVCYVISGQETTLGGASNTGNSQSAPSVNITTTRANSIIIGGISDWNAVSGASRTYRDGSINERLYHFVSTKFTAYGFDRAAASVTSYTEGLSAPTGQSGGTVLYEVRPPASVDVTPPSAPTLSSPAQGSSTIDLSWTTSTDNVGVTGYEIYKGGVYQTTVAGTTHQLTGLAPSTSYSIYVRAVDAASNGTNSNTINPSTGTATGVTIVTVSTDAETSSATQHALTSVPAGALLVLTTMNANDLADCSVSSSPSLTWTKRADAEADNSGNAEIYTAIFTAGGNITVTSNWGSNDQSSVCYVVTNYEEELAGNVAFVSSQSAPSLKRNTSRDSSIIFCATSDWNAVNGSSRSYRNSATERLYGYNNGSYTYYHYTKQATTAAPLELGLSAPASQSAGTVSFEVRRAPGVGERQNLIFDQSFEGSHSFDNFSTNQDAGHAWSRQQSATHKNEGDSSYRAEVRSGCDGYVSSGYRCEILPSNITDDGVMWYGLSIYLDEPYSGGNWIGSEA